MFIHCQVGEKRAHGFSVQLPGMPLAMKKNVPFDPSDICLLSPQAEMSKASYVAHLFKKFAFRHGEALYRQLRTYDRF